MKHITLNTTIVPYQITKKKNKNTYFYFKKEGYIQINLSKYQSTQDALNYMKQNQQAFLNKYLNVIKQTKSSYSFLGSEYETIESLKFGLDFNQKKLYTNNSLEHTTKLKQIEKEKMLSILNNLKKQYKNNPYIDISNITLRTRYTKTRHGSCNKQKKSININLYLVRYDVKYIEYVFLHEITHLVHANHKKEFYQLFEQLCPNYKQLRKELKEIYR